MSLVEFFYPKKCVGCKRRGKYFCDECLKLIFFERELVCPGCNRLSMGGVVHLRCKKRSGVDGLVSLLSYRGLMKVGIKSLKYDFLRDLEKELREVVVKKVGQVLKSGRRESFLEFLKKKPKVVPVPLYWRRKNWRGFNQAEVIAEMISEVLNLEMTDLLTRKRETKEQSRLLKSEREKNVRKVFRVKKMVEVPERVLLIDDVWTTGSTIKACGKALKEAQVGQVWGLTLAR